MSISVKLYVALNFVKVKSQAKNRLKKSNDTKLTK